MIQVYKEAGSGDFYSVIQVNGILNQENKKILLL